MEFTLIIVTLLARLAPVQVVYWMVGHVIGWALRVAGDEDHCNWLDEDAANARWFGSWLCFIEGWLDVLIQLEAGRLLKRRWPIRSGARQTIHSIQCASDACRRLILICHRFEDVQRLARLRAMKLKRLFDAQDPLGRVDPRPAFSRKPLEAALEVEARIAPVLQSTSRYSARIRAPPIGDGWRLLHHPTADCPACPARTARGNATPCPKGITAPSATPRGSTGTRYPRTIAASRLSWRSG